MTQITNTIKEWLNDGNPSTLPLGDITWRVYTLIAQLPDTDEAEQLRKSHDLGISYAIGYQLKHVEEISAFGLQLIANAYQALRNHYAQMEEE
jgi:hypothetical protein